MDEKVDLNQEINYLSLNIAKKGAIKHGGITATTVSAANSDPIWAWARGIRTFPITNYR